VEYDIFSNECVSSDGQDKKQRNDVTVSKTACQWNASLTLLK